MPRGLVLLWRRTAPPAVWALTAYWGTTLLLALTGAAAVLAWITVRALPRLAAPPTRTPDLDLVASAVSLTPAATRALAVARLTGLLSGAALGVALVAGLTLLAISAARAAARAAEIDVRRAVGASRRHLFGAGLLEGGTACAAALLVGGVGGAVAAVLATRAWPGPHEAVDLLASRAGVVMILAVLLAGVLLPLAATRRHRPIGSGSEGRLVLAVPALQLGLSLAVLASSGLLVRYAQLLAGSGSASAAAGQVLEIDAPPGDPQGRSQHYAALLTSLHRRPGVTGVSLTSPGTQVGLGTADRAITDCGQCSWGTVYVQWHPVLATHYLASADTFRMLGLSVVAGRGLSDDDRWDSERVAVVNQSLAADHFQAGQAVGRRIQIGTGPGGWYRVVGVVSDRVPTGFGGGFQPKYAVYLSVLQHPGRTLDLLVRARSARDLTGAVGGLAARRATESQVVAAEVAPIRWFGRLFASEGWVMLLIATVGTFVVMRLWVAARFHELGVRRAVGARRRHVFAFIGARAIGMSLSGVALGLWFGGLLWGALPLVIPGLPPWDSHLVLRLAALLVGAALAGAFWPASWSTRVPPVALLSREGV